mgnify:CR=1 FL=1
MVMPISRFYDLVTTIVGPQTPVCLDFIPQTDTFIGVVIVDGTADFGIEFTLDDVNDPDVTPRWFELNEIPKGTVSTTYAHISFPLRFARVHIETFTGHLELKVAQAIAGNPH